MKSDKCLEYAPENVKKINNLFVTMNRAEISQISAPSCHFKVFQKTKRYYLHNEKLPWTFIEKGTVSGLHFIAYKSRKFFYSKQQNNFRATMRRNQEMLTLNK